MPLELESVVENFLDSKGHMVRDPEDRAKLDTDITPELKDEITEEFLNFLHMRHGVRAMDKASISRALQAAQARTGLRSADALSREIAIPSTPGPAAAGVASTGHTSILRTPAGQTRAPMDLPPPQAAAACHRYAEDGRALPCDITEVNPKLRRLNALSRFLHIHTAICTAVAFVSKADDLRLVISTNNPASAPTSRPLPPQEVLRENWSYTKHLLSNRLDLLSVYVGKYLSKIQESRDGYIGIQNRLYDKLMLLAWIYNEADFAITYMLRPDNEHRYGKVSLGNGRDPFSRFGHATTKSRLIEDLIKISHSLLELNADPQKNFTRQEVTAVEQKRVHYLISEEKDRNAWIVPYTAYADAQLRDAQKTLASLPVSATPESRRDHEERVTWCAKRLEEIRSFCVPSVRDNPLGVVHCEIKIYFLALGQEIYIGVSKGCCASCELILSGDKKVHFTGVSGSKFPGVYSIPVPPNFTTPSRIRLRDEDLSDPTSVTTGGLPPKVRCLHDRQIPRSTSFEASPPGTGLFRRYKSRVVPTVTFVSDKKASEAMSAAGSSTTEPGLVMAPLGDVDSATTSLTTPVATKSTRSRSRIPGDHVGSSLSFSPGRG